MITGGRTRRESQLVCRRSPGRGVRPDPKENPEVKVEGDKVVAYPHLAQFSTVTFKVLRYRVDKEKLVISQVETVAPAA